MSKLLSIDIEHIIGTARQKYPAPTAIAFAPYVSETSTSLWGIGITVAHETGYERILGAKMYGTFDDMHDACDHLNHALGLTGIEAVKIVASSMFGTLDDKRKTRNVRKAAENKTIPNDQRLAMALKSIAEAIELDMPLSAHGENLLKTATVLVDQVLGDAQS